MKANALYAEVGYRFAGLPLTPTVTYGYATFSGDDPSTPQFEQFDPLYSGNGQDNWSFGSNTSYAFANANINFNRVTLGLTASDRDALRFQYIHSRANELRTTLELGRRVAARRGAIGGALSIPVDLRDAHLADEIYGDWTRTFNPNVSATLWLSVAFPGAGLRSIPLARTETWIGLGGSLTVSIARKKSAT